MIFVIYEPFSIIIHKVRSKHNYLINIITLFNKYENNNQQNIGQCQIFYATVTYVAEICHYVVHIYWKVNLAYHTIENVTYVKNDLCQKFEFMSK